MPTPMLTWLDLESDVALDVEKGHIAQEAGPMEDTTTIIIMVVEDGVAMVDGEADIPTTADILTAAADIRDIPTAADTDTGARSNLYDLMALCSRTILV
ncbi:hypothetical protein DdX_14232 [Ditylenchus destructor]|uniref:Uncharacterized protein n=1 Tax=Ditylenchus destructor TaxID=166010 RepID=A0AAD4R240_9BILA|nr:hypothetical protein DdX_14232 [Ditylenchus destructor]